jgi:hypothetical protein
MIQTNVYFGKPRSITPELFICFGKDILPVPSAIGFSSIT